MWLWGEERIEDKKDLDNKSMLPENDLQTDF